LLRSHTTMFVAFGKDRTIAIEQLNAAQLVAVQRG
jgi:hypothetical protein